MSKLLWTPHEQLGRATWGFAQQSRIRGFLGLSTVVHVAVAALSPWLLLTFALTGREEQLVIRTVDFFPAPEAAPVAPAREIRGRAGDGPSPPRASARVAPGAPAPPAKTVPASPPVPEPTLTPAVPAESASTPAPTPEPAPTPAPRPRDVPGVPTDPRGSTPVPYDAARPSAPSVAATEPGRGEAGQAAALAREIAGRGETGPRATVDVPQGLARGSGGGAGSAGSGSGTGPGEGAAGRAVASPGSGLVDTRDPDFSEYFRIIETRVRAAWKYPENLGGTTQTVRLGFSLRLDGAVDDVRIVNSTSGVMNDSALAAVRKAAPFPPLPAKFRSLVGQPLVMSFTVTIK
ncbi:MAG TPA: TonB family protein [Methylomirabilota bacterium]|jgi:TonB family protein|nr:TonB family protein [Methylomirabilota bacterium]